MNIHFEISKNKEHSVDINDLTDFIMKDYKNHENLSKIDKEDVNALKDYTSMNLEELLMEYLPELSPIYADIIDVTFYNLDEIEEELFKNIDKLF